MKNMLSRLKTCLKEQFGKKEEEKEEKISFRLSITYVVIAILFVVVGVKLVWSSTGAFGGSKETVDKYKAESIFIADRESIECGDVYDRDGVAIVRYSDVKEDPVYVDSYSYFQVVGYSRYRSYDKYFCVDEKTGKEELVLLETVKDEEGNIVEYIPKKNPSYRLMEFYDEELYTPVALGGTKGASLHLTLDHELQTKVFEILRNEITVAERGSVVVLDVETGEILSMVSFPAYDANNLNRSITKLNTDADGLEAAFPISHKGKDIPGSIFKVVTAVSLIDNGLEDFLVKDESFIAGGSEINNDYGSPGDEIDYYQALVRSSNCFFAKAGLEIGADKLTETVNKFMIFDDSDEDEKRGGRLYDFGTMTADWNVSTKSESNASVEALLANSAYGQGETGISTLHAAMIAAAIANDGELMEPYIVSAIKDANGKFLKKGKTKLLSEVTSKETADKVTEALFATTEDHIRIVEGDDNKAVYSEYAIASKTGTAENGDGTTNAWVLSFGGTKANNLKYAVVINELDTDKYGVELMDSLAQIYRYLFEEYE